MKRKFLMLALLLWMPLVAQPKAAQAKRAPARWWPTIERPKDKSYAEDKAIIKAIQYLLRARGQKGVIDGIYGVQTENAVKNFQRRNGLVARGSLSNATWEALVVPSRLGAQGDAVRALQTLLRRAEYDLPVNGKFGPSTRAAIMKFQNVRGLDSDGIAGKQTWCALVDGTVGTPQSD
jgi:peptidoglycan hydrolase-like protein with peptidoglycan-binding domain